jgi:predicted GIY-YIG superfamily endonuclease
LSDKKCRICSSPTHEFGHLYKCQSPACGGVFWDKRMVKKALRETPDALDKILSVAQVPEPIKGEVSKFVYVLRLKGEVDSVYVGMTGKHPYARYLDHIRGYKSSRHTKRRATALIKFEGPMTYEAAQKREPELAGELRQSSHAVYGGH